MVVHSARMGCVVLLSYMPSPIVLQHFIKVDESHKIKGSGGVPTYLTSLMSVVSS